MNRRAVLALIALVLGGCGKKPPPSTSTEPPVAAHPPVQTPVPFANDPLVKEEPNLRVAVVTNAESVELSCEGSFRLTTGNTADAGKRFAATTPVTIDKANGQVRARAGATTITGGLLRLIPDEDDPVQVNKSRFRGGFDMRPGAASGVTILNRIPMEEYLRGVVPNEIGHGKPDLLEAVKAQAVAARTYALISRGQYEADGYDLLATVADQVYSGVAAESPIVDQALAETRGVVALYEGQPIVTNYASTCGGHTADRDEVWDKPPLPYLRGVSDKGDDGYWCEGSKYFHWQETWNGEEFWTIARKALNREYAYGISDESQLKKVTITETGPSGRVRKLSFETTTGTYEARGDRIRWVLYRAANAGPLRSTLFTIDVDTSHDRVSKFTADGAGWGHGVGMCQWGAMTRSRKGQDFRKILGDYYRGVQLAALYP